MRLCRGGRGAGGSAAVAVAVASVAVCVAGCEPTPRYSTPEPPLVGLVQAEVGLTISGDAQVLGLASRGSPPMDGLRISFPPGSYPVGTHVTIRLLTQLALVADTDLVFAAFVAPIGSFDAIQILPASLDPAVPVHVEANGRLNPWAFEVLHAREHDGAWSVVNGVQADRVALTLAFDMNESGLWALGQLPLPPSLQGHLQRMQLSCSDTPVAMPGARSIDLVRNAYRRLTATPAGCDVIETGTVTNEGSISSDCLDFNPDDSTLSSIRACYQIDAPGAAVTWQTTENEDPLAGCARFEPVSERYVVAGASGPIDAGPAADAGCPSDGGPSDGG